MVFVEGGFFFTAWAYQCLGCKAKANGESSRYTRWAPTGISIFWRSVGVPAKCGQVVPSSRPGNDYINCATN